MDYNNLEYIVMYIRHKLYLNTYYVYDTVSEYQCITWHNSRIVIEYILLCCNVRKSKPCLSFKRQESLYSLMLSMNALAQTKQNLE